MFVSTDNVEYLALSYCLCFFLTARLLTVFFWTNRGRISLCRVLCLIKNDDRSETQCSNVFRLQALACNPNNNIPTEDLHPGRQLVGQDTHWTRSNRKGVSHWKWPDPSRCGSKGETELSGSETEPKQALYLESAYWCCQRGRDNRASWRCKGKNNPNHTMSATKLFHFPP